MNEQEIQERLEATLARYIAMPTVSQDISACKDAIDTLARELNTIGMFTHHGGPMHPWLVATTTKKAMDQKRVKILLVIHFDVVPPNHENQFIMQATENKLVGRGAYDMKFAAACGMELLKDFASTGKLADYDIGILFSTDEEKGGYDGALEFLQEGWRCDLAIVPDGGNSWQLEGRAKGLAYVYLVAPGVSAHSSRPWEGDNPIHKLAPAMQEIAQHFASYGASDAIVSMNSIQTSGGDTPNTTRIPDWARVGISVRAFTVTETDDAVSVITDIAQKYGIETQVTINDAPVHLQKDNPLVHTFQQIMSDVHGQPITIVDANGASDARHFATFNTPTVLTYIDGDGSHGPEEWIKRTDLHKFYDLLNRFIQTTAHAPAKATEHNLTTTR